MTNEQDFLDSVSTRVETYLNGKDETLFIDEEDYPEFYENPPTFVYEVKVKRLD